MKKLFFILMCGLLAHSNSYAQNNPPFQMGMKFDNNRYKEVPLKAVLLERDYRSVPSSFSLRKYSPTPKSQGSFGTCTGWSTAYAARTILEAQRYGWSDQNTINQNAFSAGFIYNQVKFNGDYSCQYGAYIDEALQAMKFKGVPKYKDFNESCPATISNDIYNKANPYKIKDFARLFDENDNYATKIQALKKSLSQGNPVVIGMSTPESFYYVKGVWNPTESHVQEYGGHAMCVIGYDDNKYGGAFEVQNSWGADWGENGYVWIRYQDFHNFVRYGFEVFALDKINTNQPDLSGKISLALASGEEMQANFVPASQRGLVVVSENDATAYKVQKAYPSGTKFRIYLSNNEPAYVYAIASDLKTGNITSIFPPNATISPALTYQSNNVAIPDERFYIQMDNTAGTDYLCVLYSKEALDINALRSKMQNESGSFYQKINKVLANKLVAHTNIKYAQNKMEFSATSKGKTVLAIFVEIEHK